MRDSTGEVGIPVRKGGEGVKLRHVERGSPDVAIGIYSEAATLLGVVLYDHDERALHDIASRQADRPRLLPARIQEPQEPPDYF